MSTKHPGAGRSGLVGRGRCRAIRWLASALTGLAGSMATAVAQPVVGDCEVFPRDNIWNTRVDHLPVASMSAVWIGAIGNDRPLFLDAGGLEYGIPFTVVPVDEPAASISFDLPGFSDPGPYPIPLDVPVEGNGQAAGDQRVVVVQRETCRLHELFYARVQGSAWQADLGAIHALDSNALPPSVALPARHTREGGCPVTLAVSSPSARISVGPTCVLRVLTATRLRCPFVAPAKAGAQ